MARPARRRPEWRGPCPSCGKVVPLTENWRTWGHKPRPGPATDPRAWCPGGPVALALRERIPEQTTL